MADSLTTNDVKLSFLGSSTEDINDINDVESTNEDEQALNETEGLNDKIASSKETDSSNLINTKQKMEDCQKRVERGRKRFVGDPVLKWKTINGKEFLESVTCQICGKVFERTNFAREGRLNLNQRHFRHYANHKKQSKACDCGVQFNSLAEKHRHFQNVHKSFIKCLKCAQFLANKENLEQHLKNKHIERQCDSCDYITEDRRELRLHKTIHDPKEQQETKKEKKEVKIHVCTEGDCGKTFTLLDKLKSHQRKCIKVKCHECHKKVSLSFIKKHIANIHRNNQKKYCCQKCGKRFFQKYQMEQHEQVEHEGHRFKCRYPECNKSDQEYRDQSNRVAHERKKHGATYTKFLASEETVPNST